MTNSFDRPTSKWTNDSRLEYFGNIRKVLSSAPAENIHLIIYRAIKAMSFGAKVKSFAWMINNIKPDYSKQQVAAIIGNLLQESNLDSSIVNVGGKLRSGDYMQASGAFGLAQWLWYSRVDNLLDYIEKKSLGDKWGIVNPYYQMLFIFEEDKKGVRWISHFEAQTTLRGAVESFATKFEGVRGTTSAQFDNRFRLAKKALKHI